MPVLSAGAWEGRSTKGWSACSIPHTRLWLLAREGSLELIVGAEKRLPPVERWALDSLGNLIFPEPEFVIFSFCYWLNYKHM